MNGPKFPSFGPCFPTEGSDADKFDIPFFDVNLYLCLVFYLKIY
jgi:hypothetical protein